MPWALESVSLPSFALRGSGVGCSEQLAVPSAVIAATVAIHRRTVISWIRKRDPRLDATLSPGVSQLLSAGAPGG